MAGTLASAATASKMPSCSSTLSTALCFSVWAPLVMSVPALRLDTRVLLVGLPFTGPEAMLDSVTVVHKCVAI